jgi:hypothetical protein
MNKYIEAFRTLGYVLLVLEFLHILLIIFILNLIVSRNNKIERALILEKLLEQGWNLNITLEGYFFR